MTHTKTSCEEIGTVVVKYMIKVKGGEDMSPPVGTILAMTTETDMLQQCSCGHKLKEKDGHRKKCLIYLIKGAINIWVTCDGSMLDNNNFSELKNALGNSYGSSKGKFNLPDLRGKFIRDETPKRGSTSFI